MSKRRKIIFLSIIVVTTLCALLPLYPMKVMQIKATGVSLKPSKAYENHPVTYYLQNDPQWAGDKLGTTNSTMGSEGCLVSCIATALSYLGENYTPQQANTLFTEKGVYNERGQVIWMNIKNAVPGIDYEYDRVFSNSTIEALIENDMLPIIEVKYKGFGINHWVVVVGADQTDFLVMDPLNQSKTPLKLSEHGARAYAYRVLIKTNAMPESTPIPSVSIPKITSSSDQNGNGISDSDDIIEGARLDVANKSRYKNAYYTGGYPPEGEGVCTDVIWRAFKHAGYDLKTMIDTDIKNNVSKYPRITGGPDPHIDFRRVPNHIVFFSRFGQTLSKVVDPDSIENLKEWQGGDIVSIERPEHIGIISDKRNAKGVPFVIHNMGPVPREEDCLESWNGRITGHFRYPKER